MSAALIFALLFALMLTGMPISISLGSYLMCFRFLQVSWTYFRTGDLPHHDATHVEGIEVSPQAPIALGEA